MKKFLLFLFAQIFLVVCNIVSAQQTVSTYTFASAAGTYTPIAGTNSTAAGDDSQQTGVPIGFNFIFGGTNATHVGITTNGFIHLGYSNESIGFTHFNNLLGNGISLRPLIAAFWDDHHRNKGSISYLTTGPIGSRVFTVQWDSVNISGNADTSSTLTASFQIKLFEGTNVVKIIYSNNFSSVTALSASIGLNDATFLSVTPGATATVSSTTANNAIADISNVIGKEYTFTPPTPTCAPTALLTVGNISTTGAVLTANAASGATGYQFFVTSNIPPASGTATTLPTYTASGLTANTQYYAHVRTACTGGAFSAWYTVPFKTKAIYTIPYFQNFDTAIAPALPLNTSIQDLNAGGSWFTSKASAIADPYSPLNCLVYKSDSLVPANDWFYTPAISLTAGTSYRLSYYYKNKSGTGAEKLEVKYGIKDSAIYMTNLIYKDTNIINTVYKVVKQNFTPSTTGTYYFGFHDFSNANQIALNIDDIRIEVTPACDMPTLLNVTLTSPTSGTASWAPATGTNSGYGYTISDSANVYVSGTVGSTTTTSFNFSGLFPNQRYFINVYTSCSASISVTQIMPFTMPAPVCSGLPVPYSENFDSSIVVPALKYCYTLQDLNGGKKWESRWIGGGLHSYPNVMYYPYDNVPGNDWFFTPSIHLLGGTSYKISYKFAEGVDGDKEKLEVKYGTANNAGAMTNLLVLDTNIIYTFFSTKTKSFNPPVTGDYYFGFHAISDANMFYLYVDDISIDFATDCGVPTGLTANFTTQTSGTVSWGHTTTGTVSNYQYMLSTNPVHPDTGTITSATSAPFSGLQPSTLYYLHVKSLCTNGFYSGWTTYSFYTPCGAVNIPYIQNFDAATIPSMPYCMTKFDNNGGSSWQTDTSGGPRSAPNAMVYHYNTTIAGDDWAFTPGLNLLAGVTYELSFYYKGRSTAYTEKLEVKYGNAPNSSAMLNLVFNNQSINFTGYSLAKVNFTPSASGVFYIGFHVFSLANQYDLNIDDIKVDFAPGCWPPRNLALNYTSSTTATLSWGPPITGTPTGYEYSVQFNRNTPSSGISTTTQSANLVGLIEGTMYYVFVRSACTGNAFSAWATDSFYVPCSVRAIPYTENFDGVTAPAMPPCIIKEDLNGGTTWYTNSTSPRTSPNSMIYHYSTTLPGNDWFYTAPLFLTGGTSYRLKFYYKSRSGNTVYPEKLEVKYGTGNTVSSMTNFLFSDTNIVFTYYNVSESDFTPSTTGVYFIGFHAMSLANQYDLYVDDILVDYAPTCSKPTNLSMTPTSNTDAILRWSPAAAGTSNGYEAVLSPYSTPPENGTIFSDTTFNTSDLLPGQQYYLYVRTLCANGGHSLWASKLFTFPCSYRNIPYSENFDGVTQPALPPCMNVENLNGGNTWSNGYYEPNTFPNAMGYANEQAKDGDDWFYTPYLNLTAGVSYRLSFYTRTLYNTVNQKLEVKYGIASSSTFMTNFLLKDTNINFQDYHRYQVDFVPTTSDLVMLGFHVFTTKNSSQSYLLVDDIDVTFSPNCNNPVNVAVHLSHGNGGNITWSPSIPGIPTGYEYIINTTIDDPIGTGISTVDSFMTLSGLALFTQYYFHVRTVCTNGISTWVTMPFYTLPNDEPCNAINLVLDGAQQCGNTTMATSVHDPALPVNCLPPNFTIWYKYTPAISGTVVLRTVIPPTQFPLYGSAGWYTLAGNCADSASYHLVPGSICQQFGQTGGGDVDSLRSPLLTAGVTYYLMVGGIDYNWGEFCFNIISMPAPPCTNNVYPANGAAIVPPVGSNVKFLWNKVTAATGGYDLILDTINPPTFFYTHTIDSSFVHFGLNYNKTYYWYVIPKDSLGNSSGCTSRVTSFTTNNPSNCIPLTDIGCAEGDSIIYFSLKGEGGNNINNYSGNTCGTGAGLGYSEYMGLPPAVLSSGNAYSGFIQTGYLADFVSVWIDFNDNGYFESSERLLNNLQAGTVKTLFSILIPPAANTGIHRLRIRNVYYDVKPTQPTDPCNYYTFSETEDYRVNITNTTPALRSVASGLASNCLRSSTTTIDAASNNINVLGIPLLDSNNNYVVSVYPNGNSLGRISSRLYIHDGAIRQNNGTYYMNRNININPEKQPVTTYSLRIFYKTEELDELIAQGGSGVSSENNLVISKTKKDSCTSGIASYVVTDTSLIPVGFGAYNGDKFVDVINLNSFSTFYLNGHHTYRFTGNGNWSDKFNWENQIIPPAVLPEGDLIIIDNIPGGQCILDITQHISSTASIIVNTGKNLIVPGLLKLL